jgi:hypothetical protein
MNPCGHLRHNVIHMTDESIEAYHFWVDRFNFCTPPVREISIDSNQIQGAVSLAALRRSNKAPNGSPLSWPLPT